MKTIIPLRGRQRVNGIKYNKLTSCKLTNIQIAKNVVMWFLKIINGSQLFKKATLFIFQVWKFPLSPDSSLPFPEGHLLFTHLFSPDSWSVLMIKIVWVFKIIDVFPTFTWHFLCICKTTRGILTQCPHQYIVHTVSPSLTIGVSVCTLIAVHLTLRWLST